MIYDVIIFKFKEEPCHSPVACWLYADVTPVPCVYGAYKRAQLYYLMLPAPNGGDLAVAPGH